MGLVVEQKNSNNLEAWLNTLKIRSISQNTIEAYRSDINVFHDYCDTNNLDLNDLEMSDLREFTRYCIEHKGLTNKTVRRYLTSIRGYMQWLHLNKKIEVNNAQDVTIKKQPRNLPNIISEEDMCRFLDQPDPALELDIWLWKRDKAMFEVLYSSGLRVNELINLTLQSIDYNNQMVRVIAGKGNKDRVVPLGSKAILALKEWLTFRLKKNPETNILFINRHGRKITTQQVGNRINVQAKRAGLSEHLYPHLFRHCFATHLLNSSGDIRAVQEMLGHADIASTEIYTHLDFESLAKNYDKAHPRAFSKK